MFCPACGVDNNQEQTRFCRACGADLRAVSRALSKSLPQQLASSLDAYLENRFQRNLSNGILNLVAFVALLVVGLYQLISGWNGFGLFLIGLGLLSLFLGVWDIWIYKRNLPPVAKRDSFLPSQTTNELAAPESAPPSVVAEGTTRKLDLERADPGRP